ncbi:hypothetical protein OCV51_10515 [Faecalicatena acetigenes]|uniref:Uncharacterized protein n=1 Tax=Faecalicatena acetigenes TaxID=2981790 RepID=A0ABT2TCR9_9FIRM|nr:hypothetical protein [Faecalicatena acetigenes]MCU6748079.1 hypothetical protein [Faecalicatena acetigenes]SCI24460.1 Uncharacterised protein [uncultured Clostridium sp.]
MKEFNWKEFKDKYNKIAVHCKTEEEAKDFCKRMHEHGMKWCSGKSYLERTNYENYKKETCYIAEGEYSSGNYYAVNGYDILEWSDYMKKEFTKADLKDGMVVEYSNGRRRLVVANMLIGEDGFLTLDSFRENLENIAFTVEHTIAKIYKVKEARSFNCILDDCNLDLIWERSEAKKMSVEEMREKLEELTGKKIEIEPSRALMIGTCYVFCDGKDCNVCPLQKSGNCVFKNYSDEQLKKCYEKVMEV